MKKVLNFLLILFSFLIPTTVLAESGKLVGKDEIYAKDIYSPPTARFYDFDFNNYNLYAVSTNYTDGFGFVPDPINTLITDNYGPGAVIGYDVHDVFITGYVYSVITYLCATPSSAYPMINTYRTGIQTGNGLSNTSSSYVNGGRANIIFSYNQQSTTPVTGTGNFYCGRLIHVFEATNTGTTIIVPFISSQSVSNWIFFGYSVTSYGQRNTLSSTDIQNIVNSSTSATNQAITNAENSINSNINSSRNSINNTITNSTNQIDNTIKDDNIDNPNNIFSDLQADLAQNSVISSLILLPITFYTSVLNGLNSSCSPFNLGNLLGTDIILPCINISNYVGANLWNIIDILFSGFFILHMSQKFIKVFEHMSTMKDGDVIDD